MSNDIGRSWGEAVESYLEQYGSLHHAAATRRMMRNILGAYGLYLRERGIQELAAVTREHIEEYQRRRRAGGSSPATVNADVRHLRAFLRWCEGREWTPRDPTRGVKLLRVADRDCTIAPVHLRHLLAWLDNHGRRIWSDLIRVLANTGLRINEALHLRVRHVDLETGLLLVRCTDAWAPKSRRNRDLPLERVASRILRRRIRQYGPDPDALLFPSQRGTVISSRNALRAMQQAGVFARIPRPSFKGLRQTFTSLAAGEMPAFALMAVLGHAPSSAHVTARHYVRQSLLRLRLPTIVE